MKKGCAKKLNEEKAVEILKLLQSGMRIEEIATRFGVSRATIRYIHKGVLWRECAPEIPRWRGSRVKLDEQKVLTLRALNNCPNRRTQKEYADALGVSHTSVNLAINKKRWKNVTPEHNPCTPCTGHVD